MAKGGFWISVILVGLSVNSVFGLDVSKWKYRADIIFEPTRSEYYRLSVSAEVYNAARRDLADIRIVGADGEQVPYVPAAAKDTRETITYGPAVIKRSTTEEKIAMVTLDFGKQVIKNSIEVETSGSNFRRRVEVEGSNDNVVFYKVVEQAFVFAIGDRRDSRFNTIDLPSNDFRYLRISVWPMAGEQESPVIAEAKVFRIERRFAERQPVEMIFGEHSEDDEKNISIYTYDLQYQNLPVTEIEMDVSDSSFYRYITVEGRDAATREVEIRSEDNRHRFEQREVPWRAILSDTIYRYVTQDGQKKEKLVLRIGSGGRVYRYLKITIKNYDDRPLTVNSASAKMIAKKMLFPSEGVQGSFFYVGCATATKPTYDLGRILHKPLEVQAGSAILGRIVDNPVFGEAEPKPAPWSEKHKALLIIVMAGIVFVLGVFIVKSLKSIQSQEPKA